MFGKKAVVTAAMLLAASVACAQQKADKPAKDAAKEKDQKQATPAAASKLTVGDRAPELAVERWVKGDAITGFEKGRVYVVEFWATWCGPCIKGMPHLSELQKEYKEKGVTVVGVNIWDDPVNVDPFMKDRGEQTKGDELMQYTVAVEKKDDPADVRNGVMAKTWMRAANRNGIPSAFIVDKTGTVAWIGHPGQMDEPLKQIVAGEWDIKKAAEKQRSEQDAASAMQAARGRMNEYMAALKAGEIDKATEIGTELVNGPAKSNAAVLNQIAWFMIDPEGGVEKPNVDLAMKAAKKAVELTESKDAAILDTLALCYHLKGDNAKAIELQTKAVELAPDEMKEELEGRLEQFKKGGK